ncbi:C39 family peptidase [Marinobacteraceae bacterium S3BR75-40.1]
MFLVLAGSVLTFTMVQEATVQEPHDKGVVLYQQNFDTSDVRLLKRVKVEPLIEQRYRNIVRQAYDYSCGAAALTTVFRYYLGRDLNERQVMEGLLHYGESERIVERRAFSMLDMKRLAGALGYPAGGFKAELTDLIELDHPAIVPIQHGGFDHFVVVREIRDGRVFIADPSLGNISFTLADFQEKWKGNVLFIVFPGGNKPIDALELKEEDLRFVDDQTITLLAERTFPEFHEALQRRIQNELERQKNNPDGTVENTRKQLHYRRN